MSAYRIAVIPGDGIGQEVTPAAQQVLDVMGNRHGLTFAYDEFDWSCERYADTGEMMPESGLQQIEHHDAILLGAVGWPSVPDHVSLWGLLIPIRRAFSQYVNLRPMEVFAGLPSPLRSARPGVEDGGVKLVIVRENVEGEYSEIGGRSHTGSPHEQAIQTAVFTRAGVQRIAEYAFEVAVSTGGSVTAATKSNGIIHTMAFWDEVVGEVARRNPTVSFRSEHIDALAAKLVLAPQTFDVIVGSNLFGDILSDLTAAVSGSIGIAPSGNLDPTRAWPSMFEPVHGSAPDIAGQGLANPIGAIWSASMMLDHLGHAEAGAEVLQAIRTLLADGSARTRDLGGTSTTQEVTKAIIDLI